MAKGEVDLHVGNKARVISLDIGTYYLSLPSGLMISVFCYVY